VVALGATRVRPPGKAVKLGKAVKRTEGSSLAGTPNASRPRSVSPHLTDASLPRRRTPASALPDRHIPTRVAAASTFHPRRLVCSRLRDKVHSIAPVPVLPRPAGRSMRPSRAIAAASAAASAPDGALCARSSGWRAEPSRTNVPPTLRRASRTCWRIWLFRAADLDAIVLGHGAPMAPGGMQHAEVRTVPGGSKPCPTAGRESEFARTGQDLNSG